MRLNVLMTDQQGNALPPSETGDAGDAHVPGSVWDFSASDDPAWVGGDTPSEGTSRTLRPGEGTAPAGESIEVRLAWLELPERLEQHRLPMPPDTADFLQVAQLGNMLTSLFWGHNDFYVSPAEKLAGAQARPDLITRYVIALLQHGDSEGFDADGRIIGYGVLRLPQDTGAVTAQAWVGVHPGFRRRGVGTALAQAVEDGAREAGRTVLQSWTDHRLLGDETEQHLQLDPSRPDAVFARSRGFASAQTELVSVLDLSSASGVASQVTSQAQQADQAEPRQAGQYEVIGWTGTCPPEHLESFAELIGRMSQDAPAGQLTVETERWDADRVRRMEAAREAEGLVVITAAVRNRSSGMIVGHSDIESYEYLPQAAYQANTLIHPDHRGQRLALLLKAQNVLCLLQVRPEAERLYTWNAIENTSILRTNARLGFTPTALMAAWEKSL